MTSQIDAICARTQVWPTAVLAGHAHNYQRFTRTRPDGTTIPYVVCGNGGHNVQRLTKGAPLRTPQIIQEATATTDQISFDNYDDQDFGYLRLVVTASQLRIEYHPASDGPNAKTPDDHVTVDIRSRSLGHFAPPNLGRPAEAEVIRHARASQERTRNNGRANRK